MSCLFSKVLSLSLRSNCFNRVFWSNLLVLVLKVGLSAFLSCIYMFTVIVSVSFDWNLEIARPWFSHKQPFLLAEVVQSTEL